MTKKKLFLLLGLVFLLVLVAFSDLSQWLSLSSIQQHYAEITGWVDANFWLAIFTFCALYTITTALSLPGAVPLSLLGGALFGTITGTILVSFASTFGATVAFLAARYFFRSAIEKRFRRSVDKINKGVKKQGTNYLLTLRLVPIFPFSVINLAMGITQMPLRTYFWVSQLGMFPATVIFVNAGTQLSQIKDSSDILSPALLISLCLLGLLPLLGTQIQAFLNRRRVYKNFTKPEKFDRNLIVIGAGAAGLVSSYIAAATKAKVTLIEREAMGGDCLNTGCVPSKALLRSARFVSEVKNHQKYGIKSATATVDFAQVMQRVKDKIAAIEPHDSIERYESLGVECLTGTARIITPWEVEINEQRLTARNIILATGARPRIPDIEGVENTHYLTSDTIWNLTELPKRLVVVGGGAIGCELGQCFARLGSKVSLIHRNDRLLDQEDIDVSTLVEQQLKQDGIDILTSHSPVKIVENTLTCEHKAETVEIAFSHILFATGRQPNIENIGLEQLGIDISDGSLDVNEQLQTSVPNILAAGDLIGPYRFTHAASHQAWYATVNSLFGKLKQFKIRYDRIPITLYSSPEVARIGLNEQQAQAENIPHEVFSYSLTELDRAITDSTDQGFVKVLTRPGSDTIIGVTIVSDHASDMISEFALAMQNGLGLNKILATTHPYPSYPEANKFVAGRWRQAQTSPRTLKLLTRFHQWMRGEKKD